MWDPGKWPMVREEVAVSMESGVTGVYSCQVGLSVLL